MIFLIDKIDSTYHVIVYNSISDLTSRVEWQDVFEGKSIIIDEKGIEYEWDTSKKNEIGTVHNYTLVKTSRVSDLTIECLKRIESKKAITEFTFKELKNTHKLDAQFVSICQEILDENLDFNEWKLIESSGQFQTENYCGGFDSTENEFTFSYFDKSENEYWFQLPLSDIEKVKKGIITEVEIRKAE